MQPYAHNKMSLTIDDVVHESLKFGFRTLSKSRWDQLKQEYLAYRRELVDELVAFNETASNLALGVDNDDTEYDEEHDMAHRPEPEIVDSVTTTLVSPYPLNCLVFMRNVHPETNKTTLRKLFSVAFDAATAEGLDYIDFNKGMDSVRSPCYYLQVFDY